MTEQQVTRLEEPLSMRSAATYDGSGGSQASGVTPGSACETTPPYVLIRLDKPADFCGLSTDYVRTVWDNDQNAPQPKR